MKTTKSLFITFEGIEACGKSTQATLLKSALIQLNHDVILTREPGGTEISEEIRRLLLNPNYKEMTAETELLLYLAARSQHTSELILPALLDNIIVICDRYFDSTIAYQGAARKLDLNIIKRINTFATSGLIPDITFILDIPVEVSIERQKNKRLDRMENENFDFHVRVREGYLNLLKNNDDNMNRFCLIDATQTIEHIHQICNEKIKYMFNL